MKTKENQRFSGVFRGYKMSQIYIYNWFVGSNCRYCGTSTNSSEKIFFFFLKLDGETLQHRTQGEKDLLSPVSSVSVNFFFLLPGFTDEVSLNNCNFTLTKVMVILQKIIPTTIDLKSNQGRKLKKNFHGWSNALSSKKKHFH